MNAAMSWFKTKIVHGTASIAVVTLLRMMESEEKPAAGRGEFPLLADARESGKRGRKGGEPQHGSPLPDTLIQRGEA